MVVTTHQPNYLPWPGYFSKLSKCDLFVFLDSVQFPRGASFVARNRIKAPSGKPLWLTVPVKKKGTGLQPISEVLVDNQSNWRRRHLGSFVHSYSRAPYFKDYRDFLTEIYESQWVRLVDLNTTIIRHLARDFRIGAEFKLSSELEVEGKGSEILVQVCERLGAKVYLSSSAGRKHLDVAKFNDRGISVQYYSYYPSVYPQLWGDFVPNLSVLDLLFNCGIDGLRWFLKSRGGLGKNLA